MRFSVFNGNPQFDRNTRDDISESLQKSEDFIAMDIRCSYKLHGIMISDKVLEVKCDSRLCGAGNGVIILHRFSLKTGSLIETVRFKQPRKE